MNEGGFYRYATTSEQQKVVRTDLKMYFNLSGGFYQKKNSLISNKF